MWSSEIRPGNVREIEEEGERERRREIEKERERERETERGRERESDWVKERERLIERGRENESLNERRRKNRNILYILNRNICSPQLFLQNFQNIFFKFFPFLFSNFIISCHFRYFQLLDSTVGMPLTVITTSYLPANARYECLYLFIPFIH